MITLITLIFVVITGDWLFNHERKIKFYLVELCLEDTVSKSLHEQTDNNLNTIINTALTVSLQSNTPACPNCDTDISLLSEGIDFSEQFFDTQLQNLIQMYLVKSNTKEINTNNASDILIESFQDVIRIFK